jgi:phage terminase Nu1 subunit (DNA packaging protein)
LKAKPKRINKLPRPIKPTRLVSESDEPRARGLVTRAEAAAALGVTPSRINRWTAQGAPCAIRGRKGHSAWYDVEAIRAWHAARSEASLGAAATAGESNLELSQERAKLAHAQRLKLELDRAVRLGELLPAEAVVSQGQAVLGSLKARLMGLPRQAVHRGLIDRSQEAGVKALVLETLRELARWHVGEEALPDGEESEPEEMEATA